MRDALRSARSRARIRGLGTATYWGLGLVSAQLLFVSVLVHELGHSLMAGAHGLLAQSIADAKHLAH